jgi:hypothetical protein
MKPFLERSKTMVRGRLRREEAVYASDTRSDASHRFRKETSMKTKTKALFALLCAAGMLTPLAAQAGEVRHREIRQENRIYQGVQYGTLTTQEYDRLQADEARLNDLRARDLHSGGGLSRAEYRQLNADENRLSHQIYRTKHDGPDH